MSKSMKVIGISWVVGDGSLETQAMAAECAEAFKQNDYVCMSRSELRDLLMAEIDKIYENQQTYRSDSMKAEGVAKSPYWNGRVDMADSMRCVVESWFEEGVL